MEPREYTQSELRRNAAIVVAIIVAFSCVLIYGVRHLDAIAHLASASDAATEEEQPETSEEQETQEVSYPTDPIYVLLIGSDTREGTAFYTGRSSDSSSADDRADVMTLMRVDPATQTITLVTIPRDTLQVGTRKKLNDTLLGGHPERTVQEVEKLTGVDIDYYMVSTFMTFEMLVDDLEGVDVDVPKTISFADPITADMVTVKEGKNQHLNGSQALVLARVRKAYGEAGDMMRQQNVRNLEVAIIEKCLSHPELAVQIFGNLEHYVETDMTAEEIASYASAFAFADGGVTFYMCYGPYHGTEDKDGVWVIEVDEEAWAAIMAKVDAGENPSSVLDDLQRERNAAAKKGGAAQEASAEEDDSSEDASAAEEGEATDDGGSIEQEAPVADDGGGEQEAPAEDAAETQQETY